MFSICLVRQPYEIDIKPNASFKYVVIGATLTILLVWILSICAIFRVSHSLIRPLRKLNTKMQEVMGDEGGEADFSSLTSGQSTSEEITKLYTVFADLIKDKQFSQNDFLKNPDSQDVLSIINLAATCQMYEKESGFSNAKATGVCYNNIGNLHLKNGKY